MTNHVCAPDGIVTLGQPTGEEFLAQTWNVCLCVLGRYREELGNPAEEILVEMPSIRAVVAAVESVPGVTRMEA